MVVSEIYRAQLSASGKLKLRAKARLADGGPDDAFEACVLLHETARTERRALAALPLCPPETRLRASVEECWSLVEGRDPPGAGEVWGRILGERAEVEQASAAAMLERLTTKYSEQQRAFAQAVAASKTLRRVHSARSLVPTSATERTRARQELAALLLDFPGATSFWWAAYRLAEADGDKRSAWDALTKARRLAPENRRFEATSLLAGAWALPVADADRHLARVRGRFDSAGAEACLMYALAEIRLARRDKKPSKRQGRWERAHRAWPGSDSHAPGDCRSTSEQPRCSPCESFRVLRPAQAESPRNAR